MLFSHGSLESEASRECGSERVALLPREDGHRDLKGTLLVKASDLILAAVLTMLSAVAAPAATIDQAQTLRSVSERAKEIYGFEQHLEIMGGVRLIKDAGLSYQASLAVPLTASYACKDPSQVNVLSGMLAFDANYAMAFGKKKEYLDTQQFLSAEIEPRIRGFNRWDIPKISPAASKALGEDITNPENQMIYYTHGQRQVDAVIQAAAADPEAMALLFDNWYGAFVEGLHVVSNLALNAEGGDLMLKLFNEQLQSAERLDKLLHAVRETEQAGLVHQADRCGQLHAVIELIRKRSGQLGKADIEALRALAEKTRPEFVKPCN